MNIELRIPERYWAVSPSTHSDKPEVYHRQLEPTWTDTEHHRVPEHWEILVRQDQFERSYGY